MDADRHDTSQAGAVRAGMHVVGPDGDPVGTVSAVDGDRIVLTDPGSDGLEAFLPLSLVAGTDGERVLLRARGDANFGLEAGG